MTTAQIFCDAMATRRHIARVSAHDATRHAELAILRRRHSVNIYQLLAIDDESIMSTVFVGAKKEANAVGDTVVRFVDGSVAYAPEAEPHQWRAIFDR